VLTLELTQMPFLNDTVVRELAPPIKGNKVHFDQPDANIPETADIVTAGLGIRVTAAGHRAWVFDYRLKDGSGKQRRLTIARFPYLNTAAARKRARKLREEIEAGGDPQGEKAALRKVPTIAKLAEDYDAEQLALVAAKELRMSTLEGYRRLIRLYIKPALGSTRVTDLTKQDVKRLHRKITATGKKVQANRVVALLSAMMGYAIAEEIRADNPCTKAVDFNKEQPRTRSLTTDERARIAVELPKHTNPAGRVLQFIMVTGCRKSEATHARWADFDLGAKVPVWNRKGPDLKAGRDHTLVLNKVAVQLLNMIREEARSELGEYVFTGSGPKVHIVEIRKTWMAIKMAAKIEDFRIHDLRHHFASVLASSGASLSLIGVLLAHRSPSSTHRYIHLFKDAQLEATNRAGAVIAADAPEPAADVPEPAADTPERTATVHQLHHGNRGA
jgi:integrase